jgi:hypothetical protein
VNRHQTRVIEALQRVYGKDDIVVVDARPADDVVYVMALRNRMTVLSVGIPSRQDPDRPDVGDRVQFEDPRVKEHRYGLIAVYGDLEDTVGIIPDGDSILIWDHVNNIEIVANGD